MRNILAPIDLSEVSVAVIERASCFGQSMASNLWLLHVVPPPNHSPPFNLDNNLWRREVAKGLRDRRRQLYELAEQLRRERSHVYTRLIAGTVNTVILAEAKRIHADLIIMGSHGHGNVYHALFGGVGQKVMRKASCPVMLVHPETSKSDWHQVQQGAGAKHEKYWQ
jgi:nucleotide-binding universal stress UspA family protein